MRNMCTYFGCVQHVIAQIERQVSHCCCAKRYQVSKVAEGKYRVSKYVCVRGRGSEGGRGRLWALYVGMPCIGNRQHIVYV